MWGISSSRAYSTPTGSRRSPVSLSNTSLCCLPLEAVVTASTSSSTVSPTSTVRTTPQSMNCALDALSTSPVLLGTFSWRSLASSSLSVRDGSLVATSHWSNDLQLQPRGTSCSTSSPSATSPTWHTHRCSPPAARRHKCVLRQSAFSPSVQLQRSQALANSTHSRKVRT